jgi:hypothetical protein
LKAKPLVQKLHGWHVLGDADPGLPPPATGRLVVAVEGHRPRGRALGYEQLALVWTARDGKEVIRGTSGDGLLLAAGVEYATWLPAGWRLFCYPAGWSPAHVDRWLDFAASLVEATQKHETVRAGLADGGDPSLPSPRNLVAHGHSIVRHLGLEGCWPEPRTGYDRDGYLAELRDLREFFRKGVAGRGTAPVAGLKGEDDVILQALAAARPFPMTQEKLEGVTGISVRTLRPRLHFLRERGYICRPAGAKDGDTITEAGLGLLPGQ